MTREEKIQKVWQKKVNKANKHILTIIEDGKELDIDLIIERLEKIKETTILLRNSATLSHNAKFMAGRSSGIGTAIDLLKTIKNFVTFLHVMWPDWYQIFLSEYVLYYMDVENY